MKKILILIPFFLFAEIDPFAAGIKSGYGLSESEKEIINNKREIKKIRRFNKEYRK